MTAAPSRSAHAFDPVFGAQTAFRVVLDAMARPGQVAALDVADPRCPVAAARPLAALARTLLDHEAGFAVVAGRGTDEREAGELARYLALATGSRPLDTARADFVFVLGTPPAGLLPGLRRGVPAFPDEGATAVVLVPNLDAADGAPRVTLSGPGIPGKRASDLPGLPPETLAERDAANAEPPCGIDLILIDAAGRVLCLPRSTTVRGRDRSPV